MLKAVKKTPAMSAVSALFIAVSSIGHRQVKQEIVELNVLAGSRNVALSKQGRRIYYLRAFKRRFDLSQEQQC
jgi:hypothetical protein